MGVTVPAIEQNLKEVETETSFYISELSEKLALINLARLERLVAAFFGDAILKNERAAKMVLDIMKAELEWQRQVIPQHGSGDVTVNIERFEQTITGNNPLYHLALDNLQDEWLGQPEPDLNTIYDLQPATSLDKIQDTIAKLEEKWIDKSEEED